MYTSHDSCNSLRSGVCQAAITKSQMNSTILKHIILRTLGCLLASLAVLEAHAAGTTDRIVVSAAKLNPGGETATITVGIEGNTLYSAYEMDLTLPEGVSIVSNANGNPDVSMVKGTNGIYPFTTDTDGEKNYSHLFGCSYNAVGANVLRVSCISTASEDFTATSGNLFRFTVKASSYTRPSDINITVSNYHLITKNATQNTPSEQPVGSVTVTDECTVPVSISATNQYGTLVLPFAVTSVPAGLTVYSVESVNGDEIQLQQQESIEAFTPYILYAENGIVGKFTGKVDAAKWVDTATKGALIGCLVAKSVTEGFILQNKGEGAQFYMVAPYTYTLNAGKCYMKLDGDVTYARLRWTNSDTVNSIDDVETTHDDALFSLEGLRITRPQHGHIYIKDGKKIIY